MQTGTAELLKQLETVNDSVDDAIGELEAASQDAQDTLERFQGLGGSADRAQQVLDLLQDLAAEVRGLSTDVTNSMAAVQEVDDAKTPEENIEKLGTVVQLVEGSDDAITERLNACDDAREETLGHLEGSAMAEQIANRIDAARDALEQAKPALQKAGDTAADQQQEFRRNNEQTAGPGRGEQPKGDESQPEQA